MLTLDQAVPSPWVRRFAALIRAGGRVIDLAAGGGRHVTLLRDMGFAVTAVDRDVTQLRPLAGPQCRIVEVDLETGAPWPLGTGWDGIVVSNYLHRPLLAPIAAALAPSGVVICETFMTGQELLGRPRNPDFLLRPGELLAAFAGLTIVAFEQGEAAQPHPAMRQRIAAVNGPCGLLPEPAATPRQSGAGPAPAG